MELNMIRPYATKCCKNSDSDTGARVRYAPDNANSILPIESMGSKPPVPRL